MTRRLLLSYLLLALFVLAVLEVPLGIFFDHSQRRDLAARLERDAAALATLSETLLARRQDSERHRFVFASKYERKTGARVVIVNAGGKAVLDSASPTGRLRTFSSRPEIERALEGRVATGERFSQTLGERFMYVVVPVAAGGTVHGAVRVTYPTASLDRRIRRFWLMLAAVAAVIIGAAAVLGLQFARSITRPLRELEQAATTAGAGDLGARADPEIGPPEVRSLAESFNQTVATLESLIQSQEAFVADAAHQLRTPLAALQLGLENLERETVAQRSGRLETLLLEVARLSRLVDGLLVLARADTATSVPKLVDIAPLIRQRIDAWDTYAAEQYVLLVAQIGEGLMARASPDRLEQAVDNLLANALEASSRGSTITVLAKRSGPWAEVHVVDEGPGMSDEERARAFDRLWRARKDDRGAGLGLAIVKRLVTADGGDAELLPAPAGGLDATIRLRTTASPRRIWAGARALSREPTPGQPIS